MDTFLIANSFFKNDSIENLVSIFFKLIVWFLNIISVSWVLRPIEKLVRLKIILTSFKAISIFLLFLEISFRINWLNLFVSIPK